MPGSAVVSRHHLLKRALVAWLILIATEIIHGTVRAVFLVPVVGDFRSRQIGVLTGSLLILAIAYLLVPWFQAAERKLLISVGVLWLVLTVAFEFTFGHFVFGRSWEGLASVYDLPHGGLLLIGMAVLMLSPLIASRLRAGNVARGTKAQNRHGRFHLPVHRCRRRLHRRCIAAFSQPGDGLALEAEQTSGSGVAANGPSIGTCVACARCRNICRWQGLTTG